MKPLGSLRSLIESFTHSTRPNADFERLGVVAISSYSGTPHIKARRALDGRAGAAAPGGTSRQQGSPLLAFSSKDQKLGNSGVPGGVRSHSGNTRTGELYDGKLSRTVRERGVVITESGALVS